MNDNFWNAFTIVSINVWLIYYDFFEKQIFNNNCSNNQTRQLIIHPVFWSETWMPNEYEVLLSNKLKITFKFFRPPYRVMRNKTLNAKEQSDCKTHTLVYQPYDSQVLNINFISFKFYNKNTCKSRSHQYFFLKTQHKNC